MATFTDGEEAIASEGIDQSMLGTITRDDGTTQVLYNGHRLDYYADDVSSGDTLGQTLDDVWCVVDAKAIR